MQDLHWYQTRYLFWCLFPCKHNNSECSKYCENRYGTAQDRLANSTMFLRVLPTSKVPSMSFYHLFSWRGWGRRRRRRRGDTSSKKSFFFYIYIHVFPSQNLKDVKSGLINYRARLLFHQTILVLGLFFFFFLCDTHWKPPGK